VYGHKEKQDFVDLSGGRDLISSMFHQVTAFSESHLRLYVFPYTNTQNIAKFAQYTQKLFSFENILVDEKM
jgi:hypothetical protein